jgi:hypothetical protein
MILCTAPLRSLASYFGSSRLANDAVRPNVSSISFSPAGDTNRSDFVVAGVMRRTQPHFSCHI